MNHVKRLLAAEVYRRGRVFYSYIILFALYLCPAIWGFIYYFLAGSLVAMVIMIAITALSYLFITPNLLYYLEDR
jgi:membrane protein YdbS with pleckstrin-like domain